MSQENRPSNTRNQSTITENLEYDRLTRLASPISQLNKPSFLDLNQKNYEEEPEVQEIVPLENALSNMNEILKNLAESAEKKVRYILN